MDDPKAPLREALPDVPRWLQARALLALPSSELYASPEGFLVCSHAAKLAVAVGQPAPHLFSQALAQTDPEWTVLAAPEDAPGVAACLPAFAGQRAVLYVLGGPTPRLAEPDPDVIRLGPADLGRVPEALARELALVVADREVLGLEVGGVVTAVAYVPWETERLYDLSIDTLGPHRQKGYGERLARALLDRRDEVKRPVWGATEDNLASTRLAAKLQFRELDEIVVFAPKSAGATPS
jgi:hypothetical protein